MFVYYPCSLKRIGGKDTLGFVSVFWFDNSIVSRDIILFLNILNTLQGLLNVKARNYEEPLLFAISENGNEAQLYGLVMKLFGWQPWGFGRVSTFWYSLLFLLYTLLPNIAKARSISSEDVVVRTNLGAIRGIEQHFDDTRLRVFLGVPYAKKPTGIRRFTKPVHVGEQILSIQGV